MIRLMLGLLAVAAFLGLYAIEGRYGYDEQAAYCGQVADGVQPDYKAVYRKACGDEPPQFPDNFWLRSLDESKRTGL